MISRRFFLGGISAVAIATVAKADIPIEALQDGAMIEATPAWVPPGFMLPKGQEVSRLMYKDLFAAVGNAFGGGPTTFKLPNFHSSDPAPGRIATIIASKRSEAVPAGALIHYFVPLQSAA